MLDLESMQRVQNTLDSYRARAKDLKPFYWIFGTAIVLAILAVTLLATSCVPPTVVVTAHLIGQLLTLLLAVRVSVVDPDRLTDASLLVRSSDLNPHMLVRAMMIAPSLSSSRDLGGMYKRNDPLAIRLYLGLRLIGFRFVYIVSGLDGRVFFVSFGPVQSSEEVWRQHALPQHGMPAMSWVAAGQCRFNALPGAKQEVRLLVSLPFYAHEPVHPMLGMCTVEMGTDCSDVVGGMSGGIGAVNTDRVYEGVTCRGQGARLDDLLLDPNCENRDEVIDRVIKKYAREIRKGRKLKQYENLTGLDV